MPAPSWFTYHRPPPDRYALLQQSSRSPPPLLSGRQVALGEVALLTQIAWKVCNRTCTGAPQRLAGASRDARNLRSLLKKLDEVLLSSNLSTLQYQEICSTCSTSRKGLLEIDDLLRRYESGDHSFEDECSEVGPCILIRQHGYRARVNSSIKALATLISETEYVVRENLDRLAKEIQQGTRRKDILTKQSMNALSTLGEITDNSLSRALGSVGIPLSAIKANQTFIKSYLRNLLDSEDLDDSGEPTPCVSLSCIGSRARWPQDSAEQLIPIPRMLSRQVSKTSMRDFTVPQTLCATLQHNLAVSHSVNFVPIFQPLQTARISILRSYHDARDRLSIPRKTRRVPMTEKSVSRQKYKFLLLGDTWSGKSTVMKQMLALYARDQLLSNLEDWRNALWSNIQLAFETILLAIFRDDRKFQNPESEQAAIRILSQSIACDDPDQCISEEIFADMSTLLFENCVHELVASHEGEPIYDQLPYVFCSLNESMSPSIPFLEDSIFHARITTTGITETIFHTDRHEVSVFDPAGASCEQRKWSYILPGAHTIVFHVALSSYAHVYPGVYTCANQLKESWRLFHSLLALESLYDVSFVLMFTKLDLFEAKLNSQPLEAFLPFEGAKNGLGYFDSALTWIIQWFLTANRNPKRYVAVHCTTATSTPDVQKCLQNIIDTELERLGSASEIPFDSKAANLRSGCCLAPHLIFDQVPQYDEQQSGLAKEILCV